VASASAVEILRWSLLKLGILAANEEPDATAKGDGLGALNQLVDQWAAERLMIPVTASVTVSWPSNQQTRTIGPTGADFTSPRPVRIEGANYIIPGSSPPQEVALAVLNIAQYFEEPVKTLPSTLPTELYYSPTYPNGTLALWPVPSQTISVVLLVPTTLVEFADLVTVYNFPPAYLRALVNNLAVELAPDYGAIPSPLVERAASGSKRFIKANNTQVPTMQVDGALAEGGGSYDVYSDTGG
jgi:hypothetical protein